MNLNKESTYTTRSEKNSKKRLYKKGKRKRFWMISWSILLIVFLSGVGFIYGTNQGLHLRKMLVGSVMSTQHGYLVKYMGFLLPQSDIQTMEAAYKSPPISQTTIGNISLPSQNLQKQKKQQIRIDTIETANYTAKIMIVPDPTTIHLVETKYSTKGQALSVLLNQNNAIAGINAGGFVDPGGNGSGGDPLGTVITDGKLTHVLNGNKNAKELIAGFLSDGQFITGNYSANELMQKGVTQAVSFRPQLIVDGKNVVSSALNSAWGWAPRTALGQEADGTVVMIITDGRFYWNKTHRGASMSDLVQMFQKYNVQNAMAMDGGGSTTMIYNGKLELQPATNTAAGMRYLPNAWVVIPK